VAGLRQKDSAVDRPVKGQLEVVIVE